MEANYLTAVKTGGSAAIATDLMARRDACRLGVIGSSVQVLAQVEAIQEVRGLKEVRVFGRDHKRLAVFAERVRAVQNRSYEIIKCASADECAAGSDIVATCTTSAKPVFDGKSLQPETHINAIGSFTPLMQELDAETVVRSARVITEHVDGSWAAAGDILISFSQGLITKDKVAGSAGDLLTGKIRGRESGREITLYESVGSCMLDLALAVAVYYNAVKEETKLS